MRSSSARLSIFGTSEIIPIKFGIKDLYWTFPGDLNLVNVD